MASPDVVRDVGKRASSVQVSSPSSPAALDTPAFGPPEVQVHDPESPVGPRFSSSSRPPTTRSQSTSHLSAPPPPSPSASSSASRLRTTDPDPRRSSRRRSVIDPLSGFFSNLLHLRDHSHGQVPSSSRGPTAPNSPTASSSKPAVVTRPTTPPPSLPAPSLAELGLSLTPVTAELSAPQFNTPNHGTFLSPNYLLLCHPQGLDVLPLTGPPACQPYALVRRVAFKSVVVMEERGVLVAIAGRRDGVRVYALDDVRKAVEWRIDVEMRREHDRQRKEEARRSTLDMFESKNKSKYKSLHHSPANPPMVPPRSPLRVDPPPPPRLLPRTSIANLAIHSQAQARSRAVSLQRSQALALQTKRDWHEGSDDEALIAAGPSGSAALEERTSASAAAAAAAAAAATGGGEGLIVPPRTAMSGSTRRRRPSNLDLSASRNPTAPPLPSPAPTLMTLRQALAAQPAVGSDDQADDEPSTPNGEVISFAEALLESRLPEAGPLGTTRPNVPTLIADVAAGRVAVRRSSEGSRTLQRPSADVLAPIPPVPPIPPIPPVPPLPSPNGGGSVRGAGDRRRRWSVLDGILQSGTEQTTSPASPTVPTRVSRSRPPSPSQPEPLRSATPTSHHQERSDSRSSNHGPTRFIPRLLASLNHRNASRSEGINIVSSGSSIHKGREPSASSSFARLSDVEKRGSTMTNGPLASHPAPKLEYVKLPGTKGAVTIKAVETAKKSFLAILCGEAGEKVELFAGTYRTALGLSRTFILPDSPRSLELQLQGDDLVEVFLVFSQNVFGLEPATVRVREVRIGRAERRAARRRARERTEAGEVDDDPGSLAASVVISAVTANDDQPNALLEHHPSETTTANGGSQPTTSPSTPTTVQPQNSEDHTPGSVTPTPAQAEELAALAAIQMGPYTTFQQLSFAPPFPLAVLSDDSIIPPTYKEFVEYRAEHEPDESTHVQPATEPPISLAELSVEDAGEGSSAPQEETPVAHQVVDVKWCYRDPKGIVQGPWKTSTMHAWFKDGYLPTDLPIRQESETEYTLLKDLINASPDPLQPFLIGSSSSPTQPSSQRASTTRPSSTTGTDVLHPTPPTDSHHLLHPISLLRQPRHFGPPALFFSSRGGHSTSIVDHRGRSVLKGRLQWTSDAELFNNHPYLSYPNTRMGDVTRLEAFEVAGERAVVVALRQGGMEAVDIGDALLQPADDSRTALPYFNPAAASVGRRQPWLWKMGTPLVPHGSSSVISLPNSFLPASRKKSSSTPRLSTTVGGRGSESGPGGIVNGSGHDDEFMMHDELLFLGRHENQLYCCERNSGTFRVLVLSTL